MRCGYWLPAFHYRRDYHDTTTTESVYDEHCGAIHHVCRLLMDRELMGVVVLVIWDRFTDGHVMLRVRTDLLGMLVSKRCSSFSPVGRSSIICANMTSPTNVVDKVDSKQNNI